MSVRFVAPAATTIADVLARVGESNEAIVDGRVFLGRKRVERADWKVPAGAEVLVHPPRADVQLPDPFVLHHGKGVLAVDKPAGIPTVPDVRGARGSLLDYATRIAGHEPHPTSRLDRGVSGVVTFALDDRAQQTLAAAREAGHYHRRYVAIACGELPDTARWTWSIDRARDPRLRRVSDTGKPSATRMRVVSRSSVGRARFALLAVAPETGRTHQIRVHASAAGAPLVGDRDYGGPTRLTTASGKVLPFGRIALHCARVDISHENCIVRVASPVSRELVELAHALGLGGFEEALACEV